MILSDQAKNLKQLNLKKDNIFIIGSKYDVFLDVKSILRCLNNVAEIANFIKRHNIDVVMAIMPLAMLKARLTKVFYRIRFWKKFQLVSYYRDVDYDTNPINSLPLKIFNLSHSLLARLADDRCVFISKAVKNNISNNFFTPKLNLTVPNSLPQRIVERKLGFEYLHKQGINIAEKYSILFPGRLDPKKGHKFFITAFSDFIRNLKLNHSEIIVLLAGEGWMRNEIENLISKLDLNAYIFLLGEIQNQTLLSLYKICDLVVIPSLHEGFGNVAIEGLQQQSLMLVSNSGGLDEIIQDRVNGYKFVKGDKMSFIKKLTNIYQNRDNITIDKELLLKNFKSKYTVEKQMDEILAFLETA